MKIPRSLGRYEVVDLIGQGGMGALYRARDPRIGRYVAIKVLRRDFDTPELRDRFSREARAAGSLSHPNIVTIYDVGEDDGLPFIAMEYVRGETFADLVCLKPPLSILRKMQLTEEVCAGLAHAHEAGIVHRDIKPANLIVGPEGTVKILDFGIAKLSAAGITAKGAILGTLNYMSPEQIKGTMVDTRADIFSVGAVLYELLSHQLAFPGRVHQDVLHQIVNGVPIPITEYCPDLDPRLVRLVDRALEKDPARRLQDIASVQRELASIRLSPPPADGRLPAPRQDPRDGAAAPRTPPPASMAGHKSTVVPDRDLAKQRARLIEQHLAAATQAFDARAYDAAIESCKQVLMLDAADARAVSQLDRIHAAMDEQQVQEHVAAAHAQLSRGAAAAAMREVKKALALDPQNAEVHALGAAAEAAIREHQEDARVRSAVADARERFVNGEHQSALQALEALTPTSNALVTGTLEELRLALREIEEQRRVQKERVERARRIGALLSDGRNALQGDRIDEAAQVLALLRDIDATPQELSDFPERVQRAKAVAQLNADVERTLHEFDELLTQPDLPRAGERLQTAVSLASTDARVLAARKRFEQATAALAAREAAEARRREAEQRLDEAAAHLETGDLVGAGAVLEHAAELAPQHPRVGELSEQLREAIARHEAAEAAERLRQQIAERIGSASQRFQSAGDQTTELLLALRDINQALALDAQNAEAQNVKKSIEEALAVHRQLARVAAVINNARSRFANGKYQAALRLLEEFQPTNAEITSTLSELRGKLLDLEEQRRAERERLETQGRVAALLAQARTALSEQQFDAALDLLANAGELDAAAPGLPELTERAHQEQAAARQNVELERLLAALAESLTLGDLSAASERLRTATALGPTDPRVQPARERLERAVAARDAAEARARDLEEKNTAAEQSLEQGDLQGAMRLLKLAASINAEDPRTALLAERVEEAVKQQAAADAAERLRRTVDELHAAAVAHLESAGQQAHGVTLAKQKIAELLALVPDHTGALALKAQAEAVFAAQRQDAFIRAAVRNARNRFTNGKHHAALQLLESLDPSSNPVVAATLTELRAALQEIEEKRRAEQELAERRRQTEALISNARAAIAAERFAEALEALSAARSIDATAAGLSDLTARASQGQAAAEAAARLESELSRTLADLDDRLGRDELAEAGELLRAAIALQPTDRRVRSARQRVDEAIATRKTREAAEAAATRKAREAAEALAAQERDAKEKRAAAEAATARRQQQLQLQVREAVLKAPERQRIEREAGVDDDATKLFVVGGADVGRPGGDETELLLSPVAHEDVAHPVPELTLTNVHAPERIRRTEAGARPERWKWLVGGGLLLLLLLLVLVAVFRAARPARPIVSPQPSSPPADASPAPSAPAVQPQPSTAAAPSDAPSPAVPATFAVTLVGKYPFEVVFSGGVRRSAETHRLVLPEGTTEVRLRNPEYFLDTPIVVKGVAGETKTVSAPALASLTVYSWNEVCEIAIDGRRAGYHPLTQSLVTGPHQVSIRCPDGTAQTKRVVVFAARSEPVTFTKQN